MLSITNPIYTKILNAVNYFQANKQISILKCAEMFSIHRETLAKYLKEYGFHEDRRSYLIDESFFEKIDNEEKAYWLGFLLADGCIKSNNNQISIGLSYKDIDHLKKFKTALKSNKDIIIEDYGTNYKQTYKSCYFKFNNKKIYNDLIKLGFSNKKSLNEHPSNIPNDLIRHYIRGIFDGDGWITFNKNCAEIGFGMGKEILLFIKKQFEEKANIKTTYDVKQFGNIYRYRITSKKEILKVLNFLYKDSTIYLKRKYQKHEKYLKYCRLEINPTEISR